MQILDVVPNWRLRIDFYQFLNKTLHGVERNQVVHQVDLTGEGGWGGIEFGIVYDYRVNNAFNF